MYPLHDCKKAINHSYPHQADQTIELICESIRAPIVSATGISNYILDLSKIYKNSNSYFRKDEHTYHIKPFKAFGSRKESFLFWIITHDCLIFAGDRGRCSCFAMTFSIWKKKIIVITLLKSMAQKLEGNISNKQQLQKNCRCSLNYSSIKCF